MFEQYRSSEDPGLHPDVPVEDLFGHLERYRINENVNACPLVYTAAAIWFERMRTESELVAAGGVVPVGRSVYSEIATALGCSATVAHTMVEVGVAIQSRFPRIYASFDDGVLDYARVRTVVTTLREASDATVAAIECDVRYAAKHLTPGPLRAEIWRLWIAANPAEAAEVRARAARTERTVYVRRGDNGMAWLSACITDLEGAEADALLDEIAATVCAGDPRSRGSLRSDGLMALLHGERILRCRCEQSDCPTRGVVVAPRRAHLVQILIDVHTLLGLSADPARLADGTALDPELARTLAADATWQAILTELRTVAETYAATTTASASATESVSGTDDSVSTGTHTATTRPDAGAESPSNADADPGGDSAGDGESVGSADVSVPTATDTATARPAAVTEPASDAEPESGETEPGDGVAANAGVDESVCSTDVSVSTATRPVEARPAAVTEPASEAEPEPRETEPGDGVAGVGESVGSADGSVSTATFAVDARLAAVTEPAPDAEADTDPDPGDDTVGSSGSGDRVDSADVSVSTVADRLAAAAESASDTESTQSDDTAGDSESVSWTDNYVPADSHPAAARTAAGTESASDAEANFDDDDASTFGDGVWVPAVDDTDDETDWDTPPIIDPPPVHTPHPLTWVRGVKRGRKHRRPGTVAPAAAQSCPHVAPGVGTMIEAILAAIAADPSLRAGVDPTGHGDTSVPPPGALTYRASAETLALVRAIYPTCVFPGCQVPSARCELDHRVPFVHFDPLSGGWTIVMNTQPLCKGHHDVKTRKLWTCVLLAGGAILWTSPRGTLHVTLPAIGYLGITPDTETTAPIRSEATSGVFDPVTPAEADELLYQPTWWEHHFGDDSPPLSPADIADDEYLYNRYRQHKAVVRQRDAQAPPPF